MYTLFQINQPESPICLVIVTRRRAHCAAFCSWQCLLHILLQLYFDKADVADNRRRRNLVQTAGSISTPEFDLMIYINKDPNGDYAHALVNAFNAKKLKSRLKSSTSN